MKPEYKESIDRFLELREWFVLPTMEKIRHELEQEGWYCVVGDLNPFKESNLSPESDDAFGFVSLSIVDIENRLAEYIFVFFQNGKAHVVGDGANLKKGISLDLNEVTEEEIEKAIRKFIDDQ